MKKKFNFPYSELIQRGDHMESIVIRDQEKLSVYGFSPDTALKIRTKADVLRDLPTDEYWSGQQMLKTNAKKQARDQVDDLLSDLKHRCKRALGEDSVNYKLFRFSRLATMNDREIIVFGNNAYKSAEGMLEALAPFNVNTGCLDTIKGMIRQLDDALDVQTEIENIRTRKQSDRMLLANELYQLIRDVCETGKLIWRGKDENNYADYVIYGSAKSTKEENEIENKKTE